MVLPLSDYMHDGENSAKLQDQWGHRFHVIRAADNLEEICPMKPSMFLASTGFLPGLVLPRDGVPLHKALKHQARFRFPASPVCDERSRDAAPTISVRIFGHHRWLS